MLGPLPTLYKVLVSVVALVVFVGFGAWAAWSLPVPILALGGATIGAVLGLVAILVLLHEPEQSRARRHPRPPHRY